MQRSASPARLVAAADAERRAIERALHDGVQQDLVALAVRLQLARTLAESDLTAALELLEEIGRDVREALDAVRAVSERIYPSLLDARGLPDALRAIGFSVEAAGIGRFPADIEATVYFCCLAMFERGPRIRLVHEAGALELYFTGGAGGATTPTEALDRVEALGGTLTVDGDRVAAAIPLYYPVSAR